LNEYAEAYSFYGVTPKSVLAAVAFSFARRLACGDDELASNLILDEWDVLRKNGIVPQRLPKGARDARAGAN
jgi:hypothetical protein